MNLKTLLDQKNNFVSTAGGTWRITNAPTFPFSLTVNGVTATYNANSVIGTGNPDVQWATGEVTFSYTVGVTCPSVATLTVENINRTHVVNVVPNTTSIPFVKGMIGTVAPSGGTSLPVHNVPLPDAAKAYGGFTIQIDDYINGNKISNVYQQFTLSVLFRIQKSALPIGRYIKSILFENIFGTQYTFTMPSTLAQVNTQNTIVSSQFINAYNNVWTYSNLESQFGILYNGAIKNLVSKPLQITSSANVNYIDIEVPIYFLPSTYTGLDANLALGSTLFTDDLDVAIPTSYVGLRKNTVSETTLLNGASLNLSCPVNYTRGYVVTSFAGNLLGDATLQITNNSSIDPTSCTSYTLSENSTPTCLNGTYKWYDNNNIIIGTTKTISVTKPGDYKLEYECDDCINCINTIPYVKTFTV